MTPVKNLWNMVVNDPLMRPYSICCGVCVCVCHYGGALRFPWYIFQFCWVFQPAMFGRRLEKPLEKGGKHLHTVDGQNQGRGA